MAKADRVLSYFPSVFATESTSLLAHVVRALAAPIEEVDTLLFRIQRAHRVRVAERPTDIVRLAAALNLDAPHFADLVENTTLTSDDRLALMRRRVERVARLHLEGLGTPWAVVEAAAILLDAETMVTPTHERLRGIDSDGYSHVADVTFGSGESISRSRIYLHENPLRRRKVEAAEHYPLDAWLTSSDNLEPVPSRIVIEGIEDRTVMPSVFCASTGEGVQFYGNVPAGSRLVIDPVDGARLDGRPIDDFISFDVGARADFSDMNSGTFVVEHDGARAPFSGDHMRLFTPAFRRVKAVPTVVHGISEWRFAVQEGVYDSSAVDFAVYAVPDEPRGTYDEAPGFDDAVFDFGASAVTSMSWNERMPCSFKVLVPPQVPQPSSAKEVAFTPPDLGRLNSFVKRCKAAGIRAFLDVSQPEWILGDGVLRSAEATDGPGITVGTTTLHTEGADLFVPLDPTTAASSARGA
jgi:hypothetical protein